MGNNQSVRSSHFQRSNTKVEDSYMDDPLEENRISISNKMVERLVEDATLAGGAAIAVNSALTPKGDYKDLVYIEKLRYMDESHSQRLGLNVEELHAVAKKIELRTANMVSVEPVCPECKQNVIDCYNNIENPADTTKCWETVGAFTKCVQDAAAARLRARTRQDAIAHARIERHVAHAREHALKDLSPPFRDNEDSL